MKNGRVKIFVEGIADKKFIEDYINHLEINDFGKTSDVIVCGGWTNIKEKHILNQLEKNSDDSGINLVIFDADEDFIERQKELNEIKSQNSSIKFELFLFPNNSSRGSLETLLINIVNPANKAIFECWDGYENCLSRKTVNGKKLTLPAIKTRVYAYLEALLDNSKQGKEAIKEHKRNYKNSEHWDLNSDCLRPLKDFLEKHL